MNVRMLRFAYPSSTDSDAVTLDIPIPAIYGPNAELELPEGMGGMLDLWRINERFLLLGKPDRIVVPITSVDGVRVAFRLLLHWLGDGKAGMIKLASVKKGATPKSRKVQVDGVVYRMGKFGKEYAAEVRRSHVLTVPLSMISTVGDEHFMQKGYLKKVVHERILSSQTWPDDIDGGRFLQADALWAALFQDFEDRVKARTEQEDERRQALRQENEARRKAQEDAARSRPPSPSLADLAKLAQQRSAERLAKLPVIHASRVEWEESRAIKDGRRTQHYVRETYQAENCELRLAGQRVYILFADGSEMIKMLKNVRWFISTPQSMASEPAREG
jgi:hypothetical protein